jgi:hypothetical protein
LPVFYGKNLFIVNPKPFLFNQVKIERFIQDYGSWSSAERLYADGARKRLSVFAQPVSNAAGMAEALEYIGKNELTAQFRD